MIARDSPLEGHFLVDLGISKNGLLFTSLVSSRGVLEFLPLSSLIFDVEFKFGSSSVVRMEISLGVGSKFENINLPVDMAGGISITVVDGVLRNVEGEISIVFLDGVTPSSPSSGIFFEREQCISKILIVIEK